MDIKPIQIRQLQIPKLESQILPPPIVSSLNSPVTVDIGLPIVDMPGCVEARNVTNETNTTIFGDDPKGVVTLCGPGVPSYDPINFEPERIILTGPLVNGFRERVVGYRLLGNECVQDTEPVPIQEQIIEGLPSGGQVVQVGGVAVIATTSALLAKPLADLLLKVVKPTVKKVIKKIAKIRGKKVTVESVRDRRGAQRVRNHAIRKLKGKE
jgi:hypothetical protein